MCTLIRHSGQCNLWNAADDPKGVKWEGKSQTRRCKLVFGRPEAKSRAAQETLSAEFPAGKNIGEHVAIRVA
jgi:hypothetical protein